MLSTLLIDSQSYNELITRSNGVVQFSIITHRSELFEMKTLAICAIFLVIQQCLAQSSGFIVRVFQYTPPSFDTATLRCFATILTPNHVLATASCVIVPSSMRIGVQTDLGGSLTGGGWSSSCEFRRIISSMSITFLLQTNLKRKWFSFIQAMTPVKSEPIMSQSFT